MVNIFQKIKQRHDIKKEDSIYNIVNQVKQGKYDINDEKIIFYCISKVSHFYDIVQLVDDLKVDIDRLISNSFIVEIIARQYVESLNNADFVNINIHDNIFNKIKEREDFKTIVSNNLDLDNKKIDEAIMEHGYHWIKKDILSLLKENSYKPFRTIDNFDFIFKNWSVEEQQRSQKNLLEMGLLDDYVYEKIIIYKLNRYLDWIVNNSSKPNIEVIDVDFEIKNETVKYWVEQSKQLGFDAIAFIMQYVKDYKGYLEKNFQIFGQDDRALFKNFIPQSQFFNCTDANFPISALMKLENPNITMVDFLANNIEEYDLVYKKYFELYQSLDNDMKLKFIQFFSNVHHFYDNYSAVDVKLLDENGLTNEAFKSALSNVSNLNIIISIDDKWMEHYTLKELQYIKILKEKPYFIEDLRNGRAFDKRISSNEPISNFIDLYFNENGLIKDFFIDSKPYFLQNPTMLKNLDDLNLDWEIYYERKEINYIKCYLKYPDIFDYDIMHNIDKFFDDDGIKPELINWCFCQRKWSCAIEMTNNLDNQLLLSNLSEVQYKSLFIYKDVENIKIAQIFQDYVLKNVKNIGVEKLQLIKEIIQRLEYSNSSEMRNYGDALINELLDLDNPLEKVDKLEQIFVHNNIPFVGKAFSSFEILHPDFQGFNFDNQSTISPVLKNSSNNARKIIVFSDLIKASFGSNNKSVRDYLKNIEIANLLYEQIKRGQIEYDKLTFEERKELDKFFNHLLTLYNNTKKGKDNYQELVFTNDIVNNITQLKILLSPNGEIDYNLADRVVSMFCHFAGFDTLVQAKDYIEHKINLADKRNRNAANSSMVINVGDLVKGVGDITYLRNILQNGSVSKEYLNANVDSDSTPLDTDLSMVLEDGTIEEQFSNLAANGYGPIWFVLKNDNRFINTRNHNEKTEQVTRDLSKMEIFHTGVLGNGHYGLRTGFSSSDINYIVMEKFDPRVGLEIAMNGFYIPVADKSGKIIFTKEDYDKLRSKMDGLSYYGIESYNFSNNLVSDWVIAIASQIEKSNLEVAKKREKINNIIRKSIQQLGLDLKTTIDGDLSENSVELIDTGSTGRGTNKPGDGDFDFMMRIDRAILSDPIKLQELKNILLENLGQGHATLTATGDFRLKNVAIDDETIVDIDITFIPKTDKLAYSTDMALKDRLETIKSQDEDKYNYVVANILLAKQLLKNGGVYKPNRGETPQGGLGGVGIENWILQNGGSFYDAAVSFVKNSENKSFDEFKDTYYIWDFGDNHMAESRGKYPNDNFISSNMSEGGYNKMKNILKDYLKQYDKEDISSIKK